METGKSTNEPDAGVEITFRIPGIWSHPGELIERIPTGFRLTPDGLILPDGTAIEFTPMPSDGQFAEVFRGACRQPATSDEMNIVNRYTVNIVLTGPGGSMQAARAMMQAATAIIRAGGAGVFIDNSGLAHGGTNWMEMADDGGADAMSFAYVGIVRGKQEVWTMGMHVMGLPDIVMNRSDLDADGDAIIEVIRYVCRGEKPVGDGHIIADEACDPRFKVVVAPGDTMAAHSPMHNPFGRLQLVSIKDIAEMN